MSNYKLFKDLPDDVDFNFDEGWVIGKFAPITLGHINLINKAATVCKNVKVVLCYDDKFLKNQSPRDQKVLTYKNRMMWLKQTFANMPHIEVTSIDETNLAPYPNGWAGYVNLLRELVGNNIRPNTPVLSSELDYSEGYAKYLPEVTHVVVDNDREEISISATMVRENLYKYWDLIPSCVRKSYALKVCVIGTESSGKSTLVRAMAKLFSTSWVEEYGREYCESELGGDESLLTSVDYEKIAYEHKTEEEKACLRANKLTFIDSNAFVTEFYHRLYEGNKNELVSSIARNEKYDLILYLTDDTVWVDDGLRLNGDKRGITKKLFEEMLEEFPNQKEKLVIISGKNTRRRHELALFEIKKMLKNYI